MLAGSRGSLAMMRTDYSGRCRGAGRGRASGRR